MRISFCGLRRHWMAANACALCFENLPTARSMPPMVTCAGSPGFTVGYVVQRMFLKMSGTSALADG